MDPISHLLVGAAVAGFSGEKFSFANPLYLASMLGSLVPDFDIAYQLRGHVAYLKNHRGVSHSIPGLFFNAALITLLFRVLFPTCSWQQLFIWTLAGNLSHLILDVLNSYGAQILWPLSKKKFSLNLLVLFDPVLAAVFCAFFFIPGPREQVALGIVLIATLYLLFRAYMRYSVILFLRGEYGQDGIERTIVMPAMVSLWSWTFLLETHHNYIVGEAKWLSFKTGIKRVLDKVPKNHIIQVALQSKLGRWFQSFTPYYHIHYYQDGDNHVVCFADLRYFVKDEFLHNATVVLSKEFEVEEAVFQPYNKERRLSC